MLSLEKAIIAQIEATLWEEQVPIYRSLSEGKLTILSGRRTGRTYILAVLAIVRMLRNQGVWVELIDHYSGKDRRANGVLLNQVHNLFLDHCFIYKFGAKRHNGRYYARVTKLESRRD